MPGELNHNHSPNAGDLIKPTPQFPVQGDIHVSHESANISTFTNKTALNPSRYNEVFGTLLGYQRGSPIQVTYFKNMLSEDNIRTKYNDFDPDEDNIHTDLQQINNFEFRLSGAMPFSWDEGEATSTGEGTTYPGFEPQVGDMFLYSTGAGETIGLFVISQVEPLSLRQGAYHKINFYLKNRLDKNKVIELHKRVHGEPAYFDKQKFLSDNITLLNHSSAVQLQILRKSRTSICKYYFNTFYDRTMCTIIRPDGVYDPYLVHYLHKKISISDVKVRPEQLLPIYDYSKSMWSLFTDEEHKHFSQCFTHHYVIAHTVLTFNTGINSIINRSYIQLCNSSRELPEEYMVIKPYVFSDAFYGENPTGLSVFESIIFDYIVSDKINIPAIVSVVENYRTVDIPNAFYDLPIYLHLIDIAIRRIV